MEGRTLILATWMLLAAPCGASDPQGYYELRAAQESLQRAGDYLRMVPPDGAGRRDRAIESVEEALDEVHDLMRRDAQPGSHEDKMRQRDEDLERERQQRDEQIEEKDRKRQDRIESR